jgi:hypothetical protein
MSIYLQNYSWYEDFKKQSSLIFEPQLIYKPERNGGRFAMCRKDHGSGRVHQEIFDISKLEWVVGQIEKMSTRERHQNHFWISQATLAPWATNRRISSIVLLNAVWVDIDIAHPPTNFDLSTLPKAQQPESLAALLANQMIDSGMPEPTYIVSTGGGLCAKFVFTNSIPSAARARWQSLQHCVVAKVGELGDMGQRWPVDVKACDASRVLRLVNSHNPRWDQPCRIVWGNNKRYDFDYLADSILPYSREQVREFVANRARFKGWDDNRAAAAAVGIRRAVDKISAIEAAMSDELARSLWCQRFEFGRAVLEQRGGVQEGDRNNLFWPMANAVAWSCTSVDALTKELASLHHAFFKHDGWTQAEAMQSAASVTSKLKKDDLYKMKTITFLEALKVTECELQTFGYMLRESGSGEKKNAKRLKWATGKMGFEKMKGLDFDVFLKETRRRQSLAGTKSIAAYNTSRSLLNQDLRAKAIFLRSRNLTLREIGKELGVGKSTVGGWLSEP